MLTPSQSQQLVFAKETICDACGITVRDKNVVKIPCKYPSGHQMAGGSTGQLVETTLYTGRLRVISIGVCTN